MREAPYCQDCCCALLHGELDWCMERLHSGESLEGEGVVELLSYIPPSYFRFNNCLNAPDTRHMRVEEIDQPESLLAKLHYLLPLAVWKGTLADVKAVNNWRVRCNTNIYAPMWYEALAEERYETIQWDIRRGYFGVWEDTEYCMGYFVRRIRREEGDYRQQMDWLVKHTPHSWKDVCLMAAEAHDGPLFAHAWSRVEKKPVCETPSLDLRDLVNKKRKEFVTQCIMGAITESSDRDCDPHPILDLCAEHVHTLETSMVLTWDCLQWKQWDCLSILREYQWLCERILNNYWNNLVKGATENHIYGQGMEEICVQMDSDVLIASLERCQRWCADHGVSTVMRRTMEIIQGEMQMRGKKSARVRHG